MTNWSGRAFGYFILAAIFAALFIGALIQGIIMHFTGFIIVALVLYFVAMLLLGITKICAWEISKDLCKLKPKKKPKRKK